MRWTAVFRGSPCHVTALSKKFETWPKPVQECLKRDALQGFPGSGLLGRDGAQGGMYLRRCKARINARRPGWLLSLTSENFHQKIQMKGLVYLGQ